MIQFSYQDAIKYRNIIQKAAESLNDADAIETPMLFEKWEINKTYQVNKRICYNDKIYKVLQTHTSQSDWKPDVAVSLFAQILIPNPDIIPQWVQPDSTNPYMMGDKVSHNGKTWESTIDNNVWEPGIYGWNEVIT